MAPHPHSGIASVRSDASTTAQRAACPTPGHRPQPHTGHVLTLNVVPKIGPGLGWFASIGSIAASLLGNLGAPEGGHTYLTGLKVLFAIVQVLADA